MVQTSGVHVSIYVHYVSKGIGFLGNAHVLNDSIKQYNTIWCIGFVNKEGWSRELPLATP